MKTKKYKLNNSSSNNDNNNEKTHYIAQSHVSVGLVIFGSNLRSRSVTAKVCRRHLFSYNHTIPFACLSGQT